MKKSVATKAVRPPSRTEYLDIQVLRLDGRRLTRSLYNQLPIEALFDPPDNWDGKPWVQVTNCPRDCVGREHLHVVWQKESRNGKTARVAVFRMERDSRYDDEAMIETAEKELAESLTPYGAAALLCGYKGVERENNSRKYRVYGPWRDDYELIGYWRAPLPYQIDEWLSSERDIEDWERPRECQLVATQPRRIRVVLPSDLKKKLQEEIARWRSPKEAFRAATRKVSGNLKRVLSLKAELRTRDEQWALAYKAMADLPEVFL